MANNPLVCGSDRPGFVEGAVTTAGKRAYGFYSRAFAAMATMWEVPPGLQTLARVEDCSSRTQPAAADAIKGAW